MAAKIFIDGEAGTTGLQIAERLDGRMDLDLIRLDEAHRKDAEARKDALQSADLAILCLPDAAAKEAVELVGNAGTRFLDASTAHRVSDGWVYGFPEMTEGQGTAIAQADRVTNPGCYPTGAIALLRPLREADLLAPDFEASVFAVSGYTGGGKALIAEYEAGTAPNAFIYATGQSHKHLPEMARYSLLDHAPIFVPSVGRFAQGMVVQVPIHLHGSATRRDLHQALTDHYARDGFVEVLPLDADQGRIDPESVNGTNRLLLQVCGSDTAGKVVLVAVLDNLGKGASGAAVQNMNLMLGLDPNAGLSPA